MKIEDINKITQKASELKNQANSRVDLFELYLDAEKLYLDAYNNCINSIEINEIHKRFLSTIYFYESLDCLYSYTIKKKDFEKCQQISKKQIIAIDNILINYFKEELKENIVKEWYKYLVDHRITAELKMYFPIGKSYFEAKEYRKALFYFRRTEEILKSRNTTEMQEDYLLNYYLNYYILKFNISQCQVGILQTDIDEKEFLERQTIKELLESVKYAKEVMNISTDSFYKEGYKQINLLLKDILNKSLNSWETLYDFTKSDYLVELMMEVDVTKAKYISSLKISQKPQKVDYFLFYTHGFNTRGEWKNDLTEVISSSSRNTNINFILLPWDYGTFKLKFFSKKARKSAVDKFTERYSQILDLYGECQLKCLIAHSFGTYITGTAIQENENFIYDKIIFAGNILDTKYNWEKLKQNNQIKKVLIEQSSNDGAVLFAKLFRKLCFQKWIGYAGRDGFKNNYTFMQVLKSESGHSGMLNKKNMVDNWFPFLIN